MRLYIILLLSLVTLLACRRERVSLLWEEQQSGTTQALTSVYFLDENRGYAVGGSSWYFGLRLETTNGGKTWQLDTMSTKLLYALYFDEQERGYAVGIDGRLHRKRADETVWTSIEMPNWLIHRDVVFLDDGSGVLAGGEAFRVGHIVRMEPNFASNEPYRFEHEIGALASPDGQTVHAVGFGIVLRSDDRGLTWELLPYAGDFFRGLSFPSTEVGYAVGYYGTILKTSDAGQTWQTLRKGGGLWRKDIPFRDVHFTSPEHGYLVGEEGTFWLTHDGGTSWKVIDNLPDWDFIGVHALGKQGWIVGENGGILHFRE